MRNWVLTAYSAGTVSFCSEKALMGRRRSAKSSGVGTVARARIRQSEGTLPFPFDPEGTDVMVLEAKARSNVTVRSPCRVAVVLGLQADRSCGFLSLTRASSWRERERERERRSLQGREDRGESLDHWLSDSGRVLRILKFTRTLRRDERV